MTPKRLYRSRHDVVVAGVCSGIGLYFNIDPVLVRVAFVLFALTAGSGLLAYLLLWAIIPPEGGL